MKYLNLFALISGISAVITITIFLIFNPDVCIIPFEPKIWIRIPEIILGIWTSIVLWTMILNLINKINKTKKVSKLNQGGNTK